MMRLIFAIIIAALLPSLALAQPLPQPRPPGPGSSFPHGLQQDRQFERKFEQDIPGEPVSNQSTATRTAQRLIRCQGGDRVPSGASSTSTAALGPGQRVNLAAAGWERDVNSPGRARDDIGLPVPSTRRKGL